MSFAFPRFRREFSVNLYKNLRFPLGEMSFFKDWTNTDRGDPYPLVFSAGGLRESIASGVYRVSAPDASGELRRFAFSFFPYATYSMEVSSLQGEAGFVFRRRGGVESFAVYASVSDKEKALYFGRDTESAEKIPLADEGYFICGGKCELVVTARACAFDIYLEGDNGLRLIRSVDAPEMAELLKEEAFREAEADLYIRLPAGGHADIKKTEKFMDCGISQADMRPIRYEDGSPMITDGRIYFTMSSRNEVGGYQSVISWVPGSTDFRLDGAIFYDTGDGIWGADVAASVIYDRAARKWRLWYCSFSHGHILARGETDADLRHGVNVVDTRLMETEKTSEVSAGASDIALGHVGDTLERAELSDDRLFYAKYGDEDPDFVYDRRRGKWLLTVCRPVSDNGKNRYRYFLFESDQPCQGYVWKDNTRAGENTGGSIVNTGNGYVFICGSDFGARSRYYKFELDDLSDPETLTFDYDDGGFRGWGTVIALPGSGKKRFVMMTFDRHCGSAYNWSYGNIYVFSSGAII